VTSERIEQQAKEVATSTARFTGTLAELSTADLIQLLQLAGKDALITVQQHELRSRLWCCAGALVDAESGRLRGEAAAYRILGFDEGLLIAELRPVERARELDVGTPRLLLEAARRKDECAQLWARLGDPRRRYRCESTPAAPEPGSKEHDLLQSFGAGRSLAEVLAESELGDWEALQAIARWRDAGALVDAGSSVAPARAELSLSAPRPAQPDSQEHSSTAPLEVEQHKPQASMERPLPPWSYAALAALVLVSSGYAFGTRAARSRAAAVAPSAAAAPAAPVERARSQSFVLELQVEPADAEIVLDGAHIATGSFTTRLPRDGSSHELRVSAPGFIDTQIWFIDAAPPRQLRLEPLPAASNGDSAAATAPAEAAARVNPRTTRVRKAPRGQLSEPAEASPKAGTTSAPPPPGDPATPVVRLIE
jgi:hypothetical protein